MKSQKTAYEVARHDNMSGSFVSYAGQRVCSAQDLGYSEGVSEGFGRERVCLKFLNDNLKARGGEPIVKGILFSG